MFRFVQISFFLFLVHQWNSLDIEEESCATTYIQWVQTHSSNGETPLEIAHSLPPSAARQEFECSPDHPGKFR